MAPAREVPMKPLLLSALLLLGACSKFIDSRDLEDDTADTGAPDTEDTQETDDTDVDVIVDGPSGWIGAACDSDVDCDYTGGVCLSTGFPRGTCSMACDRTCPDQAGHPTTFCVSTSDLPSGASARLGSGGACVSRCDLATFPSTLGCRTDYGCTVESRNNEPATEKYVCIPGATSQFSQCHADLIAAGVGFEPTIIPDAHPSGSSSLTCHVEEPVIVKTPLHGVDLIYTTGSTPGNVTMSCEGAKSLSDSVLDVKSRGVDTLRHYGTYNCRTISGTNTLSRHAFGDAIDVYGFDFTNGARYTVIDDFEKNTTDPVTAAGQFLYDTAYRWHDLDYWTIILTPNYNSAHYDHLHVDLTPGGDFIRSHGRYPHGPRYFGPAPYDD